MDAPLSPLAAGSIGEEGLPPISWSAVAAGAVGSLAVALLLGALAAGFGFKLAAPWPHGPAAPEAFTPVLGASLVAVQAISSAFGGYLAGRLRHRWTNLHDHEAHFRDTAHGFLSWAVSTLAGVMLIAAIAPAPNPALADADPVRAANIAAQISLFMAVGLLLGAFMSSVAAAIGGLRREEMHAMLRR